MNTLKIHPKDNVIVALRDLYAQTTVRNGSNTYYLHNDIPAKHKFFIEDLKAGQEVLMYGVVVGRLTQDVTQGSLMDTANTQHAVDSFQYQGFSQQWTPPDVSSFKDRHFMGYRRADGRVGTANYWLCIPTVFCENRNIDVLRQAMEEELGYGSSNIYKNYTRALLRAYDSIENLEQVDLSPESTQHEARVFTHVDGIKFLLHQGGCGGTRQDATVLAHLLAAYADHPNVAGVTVLSLGCENLQVEDFRAALFHRNPQFNKPLLVFSQQQIGSKRALMQHAIRETFIGMVDANKLRRTPQPISKLTLGVKCGGSDGFSGISANPAVGYCSDLLVALGGKVLLAEFPELCGAEQQLIDRMQDAQTAHKFIKLMSDYSFAAEQAGSGFHMNPSPGNIKDGLITDAIKSNGAAKKGGTSPVVAVLDYTEPANKAGLSLVCTPGNDVEATTGKAAAGATLILFTTGLGTPTGNPICPTIKIATNNRLATHMSDIIDINTGAIIEGQKTIEQMGIEILEYCILAASGKIIPKAVQLRQDDFIPWKRGVSL